MAIRVCWRSVCVQGRQLGLVHQLDALQDRLAYQQDPRLELARIALVGVQRAPQRQPLLADPAARLDVGFEAGQAIAGKVARHGLRRALGEGVVRGRHAQRMQVGKALEHGAHGIARALGDARSRRDLRAFAQQRQVGLDDQLLCPRAAQATTVDPGRFRSGCGGQGFSSHGRSAAMNGRVDHLQAEVRSGQSGNEIPTLQIVNVALQILAVTATICQRLPLVTIRPLGSAAAADQSPAARRGRPPRRTGRRIPASAPSFRRRSGIPARSGRGGARSRAASTVPART